MASIDGLVTGMSTTDTINQLMQIEAAPQTALKNKITTANKVVSAYQSVNSRLSSLASAATALGTASAWGAMKATASSDAAVVSAQAGASAGSISFRVDQLAATHVLTFATKRVSSADAEVVPTDPGTGKGIVELRNGDGLVKTLEAKDGKLGSVVTAINADSSLPYTAAAVQIGSGEYALQLTARASGQKAADDMTAAGLPQLTDDPIPAITTQGRNARISVGMDSAYEIESATNTFADILPGVTVTAARQQAAGDAPVTVTVAADTDGIAAKVKALVDNANVVLNEIASQSKGMTDTTAAGPLVGDSAMRKLSQDILAAVASGVPHLGANDGTASYNDVGVTVDRSGALAFDEAKFRKAYAEDPARTQRYFDSYTDRTTADGKGTTGTFEPGFDTADGLGRKLQTLALVASEGVVDPTDPTKPKQGTLQSLIQRRNEVIRGLNDEVGQWDVRLESRRSALQLQFSNLEVALGKMKQQSSWLAGQLAGLS